MSRRKTWLEKLQNSKDLPKVVNIPDRWNKKLGPGTTVIPSPTEVAEFIKQVPAGKIVTINQLREALARHHRTTIACPLTTGLFTVIAAHAEEEAAEMRKSLHIPYWRVVKEGGALNPKFPGEEIAQKERLEQEGISVRLKGKRWVVNNWENYVYQFQ